MNTSDKKLIFFDVDGTIITEGIHLDERIIPDSFPETLQRLQKNGHLCFVNTGRSYAEMDEQIKRLSFDGYICGCGTYIMYNNHVLLHKTLPDALKKAVLTDLDRFHLEWVLEGTRFIYYEQKEYQTPLRNLKAEHSALVPNAVTLIPPDTADVLDYDKFCICLTKEHQFSKFKELYQDELSFIDRGNNFYEIIPLGFSKASGIRFLEEHFQIDHEHTISIGDSTNDLPMLNYTAYSICMGNGAKELFDIVDYVTDSVQEDGILHAMEYLELI